MSLADLFGTPDVSPENPTATSWDSFVEQGNPRAVGIVDADLAYSLTEEEIVSQIQNCESESEQARGGLEQDWWLYEDLYRLRWRGAAKQDWQADIIVPEVRHKVMTLKSLMQSALADPDKFFILLKESKLFGDEGMRFIEAWMQIVLRKAKFLPMLLHVLEEAFLFGTGVMKIHVESEVRTRPGIGQQPIYPDPQMAMQAAQMGMDTMRDIVTVQPEVFSRIACEKVHLRSMFPDPLYAFGKGRYVIERFETDREVLEEFERLGIYDSLDDIGEGMKDTKLSQWERKEIQDTSASGRKRDVVQEYTGNLYKDGKLACRNWIVTCVNQKKLVRCGPNPQFNGRSRYVSCTPLPYDGRPWGESIIEADSIVEMEMKTLLDLMLDNTKFSVLGAFRIDRNKANDTEPITSIEPGRMYDGEPGFLEMISFPNVTGAAWPMVTHLQGIGDKSTMVNEFAAGTPSSRGRPTKFEVQSKTESSTGHIHNVARIIEDEFVEPALQLIYEDLVQFGADLDPELEDLAQDYGIAAQSLMDPVQRFKILDVPFRFQVRGVSMLAKREGLWNQMMQLMQVGQQMNMPPADPLKFWFTIISSMGFSPEQIGYTSGPEQYAAFQQAQQQAQAQQQGQGGAPGPQGGPAGTPPPEAGPSAGQGAPPTPEMMGMPGAQPQGQQPPPPMPPMV